MNSPKPAKPGFGDRWKGGKTGRGMTEIRLVLFHETAGERGALRVSPEGKGEHSAVWLPKSHCRRRRDVGWTVNGLPIIAVDVSDWQLKAKGLMPERSAGTGDLLEGAEPGQPFERSSHGLPASNRSTGAIGRKDGWKPSQADFNAMFRGVCPARDDGEGKA